MYNKYPDYWDRIYANVKTAYDRGLLSKIQWKRWEDRFENKDHYLGLKYTASTDSTWNLYKERNDYDLKKMEEQVIDMKLPGKPFFKK